MTQPVLPEEPFTFASLQPASGESFAAIAWRGPRMLVLEFHEVLESRNEYIPMPRETRLMEISGGYPVRMPEQELLSALKLWVKTAWPLLPVNRAGGDAGQVKESPELQVGFYSVADIRQAPYADMRRRLLVSFLAQGSAGVFMPLTATEVARLLADRSLTDALHWTPRKAAAQLAQLSIVGPYMAALEANQPPIQFVAAQLGISPVRARNLVLQARASGYLTQGQQGRSHAKPTKLAVDLVDDIRFLLQKNDEDLEAGA